jgi:hypothetical protein
VFSGVQDTFSSEKRAFYEIMWKNELEPDRPHMKICCCIENSDYSCQITRARIETVTNSMEQSYS